MQMKVKSWKASGVENPKMKGYNGKCNKSHG
jgi:hypothetical protein